MAKDSVSLIVQISADSKEFVQQMQDAIKVITDLAKQTSDATKELTKSVDDASDAIGKELPEAVSEGVDTAKVALDTLRDSLEEIPGVTETVADEVSGDFEKAGEGIDAVPDKMGTAADEIKVSADEIVKSVDTIPEATEGVAGEVAQDMSKVEEVIEKVPETAEATGKKLDGSTNIFRQAFDKIRNFITGLFNKNVKDMEKTADEAGKKVPNSFKTMSAQAGVFITALGAAVAALGSKITGFMKSTMTESVDFRKQMAGVFALIDPADRTPELMEELTEIAIRMRTEYGRTGDEVANAMAKAVGSGIEVGEMMAFMDSTARSAVGGMSDMEKITRVTSAVMKAYGYETAQTAEVQDKLAHAINIGVVEWSEMETSLGRLLPQAKMAGVSIDELMAMIVDLTLKGYPADQAMTSLGSAFVALQNPGEEAQDILSQLDVQLKNADGSARPFLEVMSELKEKMAEKGTLEIVDDKAIAQESKKLDQLVKKIDEVRKKLAGETDAKKKLALQEQLEQLNSSMTESRNRMQSLSSTIVDRLDESSQLAKVFNNEIRGTGAVLTLMSGEMQGVNTALDQMDNSAGAVNQQFSSFSDSGLLAMDQLSERSKVAREELGRVAFEVMAPLIEMLTSFLEHLRDWTANNPVLSATLMVIVGILGALLVVLGTIGALVASISALFTAFAGVAIGGILLVAAKIIGAIAVIWLLWEAVKWVWDNWGGIMKMLGVAWDYLVIAFQMGIDAIKGFFTGLWKFIKTGFTDFGDYIADIWNNFWDYLSIGWDGFKSSVSDVMDYVIHSISNMVEKAKGMLAELWNSVTSAPGKVWDTIKGLVGAGDDDAIPAMAKGGIVTRPTLALIGEAGPEAVIPLNGGGIPINFPGRDGFGSGGNNVSSNDTFNIYQQPGESAESLARRIADHKRIKRGY